MSALKNKIRLLQAQDALNRGAISQEQFDAIQAEYMGISAEPGQVAGGVGTQIGAADLPPVAVVPTAALSRSAVPKKGKGGKIPSGGKKNSVAAASTPAPAGSETTENSGHANSGNV